jgi:hypothetical protein
MGLKYLTTHIWLPPGAPPTATVRELFRLAFEEYRWVKPARFGTGKLLDPLHIDYQALIASYEKTRSIMVLAQTDRDFFLLSSPGSDAPPFIGKLTWETSVTEARRDSWRVAQAQQITTLMRLFGSPLALSGTAEDFEAKQELILPSPDGVGSFLTFTVRDPSEGLPGLFWRNFYGPPFVEMFGDRLRDVPPEQRRDLTEGIVLIQPYELPAQAMTAEGMAVEQRLIAELGAECFYDHLRQVKPSRVPRLSPLPR